MSVAAGPARSIHLDGAAFGYDRVAAVRDVSGEIREGDLLAVVGPNGAGKSTLLKGIVGEVALLSGRLDLGPVRRDDLAYLPQRAEIDRTFPITVSDFAATGLWRRIGALGRIGRTDRSRIREALGAVGLAEAERRPIGALSGGQMQRLLFARTALQDARVILLDEPFTAIDQGTAEALLGRVLAWHRDGRTIVAALHDLGQVAAHFPHTLLLAGRPVAWGATGSVLTPASLDEARPMLWAADLAPATP